MKTILKVLLVMVLVAASILAGLSFLKRKTGDDER